MELRRRAVASAVPRAAFKQSVIEAGRPGFEAPEA